MAADSHAQETSTAATSAVPPHDSAASAHAAEPNRVVPAAPLTSARDIVNDPTVDAGQTIKIPVIQENLSVEKRRIETGHLVVHVEPKVEQQVLEVPLLEESIEVERVPLNRFVEAPTPVRQEGDVTVVPVFEEVLIVEKRLMLKEEIRLTRRRVATRERQSFEVRKEEAHVLRAEGPAASVSDAAQNVPPQAGTPVAEVGRSDEGEAS
jgi:uncharacterized protein (TIGR02271 family)